MSFQVVVFSMEYKQSRSSVSVGLQLIIQQFQIVIMLVQEMQLRLPATLRDFRQIRPTISGRMPRFPAERFTVSPANLRRLPIRMTIRLLSVETMNKIRWLRPFTCGRRTIWRKLRTIRTVKALIKTRHHSALI